MTDERELETPQWDVGWNGHSEAQRRRMARLPLAEKLAWLEEAQLVVDHLRRQHAGASKADDTHGQS